MQIGFNFLLQLVPWILRFGQAILVDDLKATKEDLAP